MSIIAWIVVGIIGGFIGSVIVNKRGQGLIGDLFLGVIGAIVLLVLYHALRGRPASA